MHETLNLKENKKFTEEQQKHNELIITVIYFIIQTIVIPIIYVNTTIFKNINITSTLWAVGLVYYVLKQIYFSDSDGAGAALGNCILSVVWIIVLLLITSFILTNIEMLKQNQIEQSIDLVFKSIFVNILIIFTIFVITIFQEYIQDKSLHQKLTGHKQKIYQIEKINKYIISIIAIITGLILAVSLLTTQTIAGINWEKLIINGGIVYLTIMIGTILRR